MQVGRKTFYLEYVFQQSHHVDLHFREIGGAWAVNQHWLMSTSARFLLINNLFLLKNTQVPLEFFCFLLIWQLLHRHLIG